MTALVIVLAIACIALAAGLGALGMRLWGRRETQVQAEEKVEARADAQLDAARAVEAQRSPGELLDESRKRFGGGGGP